MADVIIDSTIGTATARGMRSLVFTDASTGYVFYIDSGGTFVYAKTTDGGATWGSAVTIASATTHVAFDVWFDQWTPGDSGTKIHTWYFDTTNDAVRWRSLDTASDTLGTERTCFAGASAVAGRGAFCSGTKARTNGYLYVAFDIDAGAERGLVRSTDGGTTWSSNLSTTFVAATIDQCLLFPANDADPNDIVAVMQLASVDDLTCRWWDSSAANFSTLGTPLDANFIENTTDLTGQMGFSASIRHSDGHLIVVGFNERDTATADGKVWDVDVNTSGPGVTAKTAITTNIDDIYHPAVFIDQNDDIYVFYNGKRDGSETLGTSTKLYYTKSTDGGATWSSGDTTFYDTAATVFQVFAPLMGPRATAVGLTSTPSLKTNIVNSVTFGNAYTLVCAQGSFALGGQAAALLRGRLLAAAQGSYALTGFAVAMSKGKGMPISQGAFAVNGQSVALAGPQKKLVAAQGSFSVGGQAANLLWKRLISIGGGSFSLNGQSVILARGKIVALAQGAFALNGQTVALKFGHRLVAAAGSYVVNGQAVVLRKGYPLAVAVGSFALNGQNVVFSRGRGLSLAFGSFALNGQNLNLLRTRIAQLSQGSFSLNGQAVVLLRGRRLVAIQGSFSVAGQAANLLRGRKIALAQGAYSLNGQAVVLSRTRKLVAVFGSYGVTGFNVGLTKTGAASLTISTGTFSLSGQPASLRIGRRIVVPSGGYSVAGQSVALRLGRLLGVGTGLFAVSGQPISLRRSRIFSPDVGTFSVSGFPVGARVGRVVAIETGVFAVAGQDAAFVRTRTMPLEAGLFALTGFDVDFLVIEGVHILTFGDVHAEMVLNFDDVSTNIVVGIEEL